MRRPPKTPSMSEQHLKSLIQELPASDNDTIGKDSDAASISGKVVIFEKKFMTYFLLITLNN